jgi:hypothetical protein
MHRSYSYFAAICSIAFLTACSASKEGGGGGGALNNQKDSGDGLNTGDDGGLPDAEFLLDGARPETSGPPGCAAAATFVYVVDESNDFYKFDPKIANKTAFTKVGTLNCGGGTQPNSMAISRDGTAYVDMMDTLGSCKGLYKVSITDAVCHGATSFACGTGGYGQFGMGFSTNSAATTDETLFVGDTNSTTNSKLAALNPTTGAVSAIGTMSAAGPEFTGNAAGELWAFFAQATPPTVAQIDKTTGKSIAGKSYPLSALSAAGSPTAWAFAFWGGDYYIFLDGAKNAAGTNVWKFSPGPGTVAPYITGTGFKIVGAGVSTCAPLVIQ